MKNLKETKDLMEAAEISASIMLDQAQLLIADYRKLSTPVPKELLEREKHFEIILDSIQDVLIELAMIEYGEEELDSLSAIQDSIHEIDFHINGLN
jgi:hypothetical protein